MTHALAKIKVLAPPSTAFVIYQAVGNQVATFGSCSDEGVGHVTLPNGEYRLTATGFPDQIFFALALGTETVVTLGRAIALAPTPDV
jgi:hypothetical protein